jgi:hypothetical protein
LQEDETENGDEKLPLSDHHDENAHKEWVRNVLINVNSYYDDLASSYPFLCSMQKLIIKKLLFPKIPHMLIPY